MPRIFFAQDANNTPNHPKLMLATIEAIKEFGGKGTAGDIRAFAIERYEVGDEEQSLPQPGDPRSRLEYYLGWGREYLKRSGDLKKDKGNVWHLTEKGRGIQNETDTARSLTEAKRTIAQEDRERRARNTQQAEPDIADATQEETAHEPWKSELFEILRNIDPYAFERLCKRVLSESGLISVEVRGKVGDGGIDGFGILRINLISFHVYFQCKRWSANPVGASDIRDFRGALQGRADKGLFITNNNFTNKATQEATRDGALAIDLIDGDQLCDLLKEHSLGVRTDENEQVTITPEWFDTI